MSVPSRKRKIPTEIESLLIHGDLVVTLMSNSLYQLLAVAIGAIVIMLALGNITPVISLVIAFVVGAVIIKAPWFIASELQRYADIRFNLISKILNGDAYESELEELRTFLRDVTAKRKIVGLDFRWILILGSIFGLLVIGYNAYETFNQTMIINLPDISIVLLLLFFIFLLTKINTPIQP